ncbi:uncharacterized protein [Ptychodera flava]|uniref:uncharacterized protein n=1 Tax=Ptychodera flava TaxID=63121 RepID=UPI00396A97FE
MVIFSDGCSSQYKSRTPFADVSFAEKDVQCSIERNYFGSRHGKGPCDGEGGVIKAALSRAVKNQEFIPTCPQAVYDFCQKSLAKSTNSFRRTFYWTETGDIQRDRPSRVVKTVKGTRKLHSVRSTGEVYALQSRDLSCYCILCLSDATGCENQRWVDSWRMLKLSPSTNTNTVVNSESAPDARLESDNQTDQPCEHVMETDAIESCISDTQPVGSSGFHVCDFILVRVESARGRPLMFLGQIVHKDGNLFQVKFMKRVSDGKYIWPTREDVSWVPTTEIISAISLKSLTNREHFLFDSDKIKAAAEVAELDLG